MCGIVGYATADRREGLDEAFLRRACRESRHRGPDAEGIWTGDRVGFGHRRLSIIDLEGGGQPMSYAGGRYRITYNGEIYNYRELRAELGALGHRFETSSDTEVILAAFAQWGSPAVARFRGIFAFGLWDQQERRLTLCRDHLGVKPLLYHADPGGIVFASEIKALLQAECVGRDVDEEGLADYLALGYTLGEKTLLRTVRRLPPGSLLTWRDGAISVQPYWNLAALAAETPDGTAGHARLVEEYAAALERAVVGQMVSDVPVGGFLSGGIDSSSVVYHMRGRTPYPLRTFSMGFSEDSYSELAYAARTAEEFRTCHSAEVVSLDLESEYPELVRTCDEPLGDTSLVPTYCVSRLARRHVKVVLTGDGADENLAGYDTYVADALQGVYRRVPRLLHERLFLPLSRMIPTSRRKVTLGYKVRQFLAHGHADLPQAHFGWRLLFDDAGRRALLGGRAAGYDPAGAYRAFFDEVPTGHPLNRSLYVDLKTWLAGDILTKVDRASMAVGLEARVPFLDVDLVETTMRLPPELKMRGLRRKIVLRRAMAGKVPDFVLKRRKSGFNAPASDWLRGPLRGVVGELFGTSSGLVDVGHPDFQGMWRAHLSGEHDHGFRLWSLANLLLWERVVLGNRRAGDAG